MILAGAPSIPEFPLADSRIDNAASPEFFHPILGPTPIAQFYPPALASAWHPLNRLILLRASMDDQTWAVAECLRCKGVGAVVATIPEAIALGGASAATGRRDGGRRRDPAPPRRPSFTVYAAATRWLVKPARGNEPFNAGPSNSFTVTEDVSDKPSLWSTAVKTILCAHLKCWPIDRIRRQGRREEDTGTRRRGDAEKWYNRSASPRFSFSASPRPRVPASPLIIVRTVADRQIIVAVSDEAFDCGIRRGMTLTQPRCSARRLNMPSTTPTATRVRWRHWRDG